MIEIKNLDVLYNNLRKNDARDRPVLKNINLNFSDPSIVLIVGESGSGKSTLANAIMGILHKFKDTIISGSIRYNGIDYNSLNLEVLNQNIGYVPQYPADFTLNQLVRDEITFPLENLGTKRDEVDRRLIEILKMLKIDFLQNRVISELSSGELQKVALATAIVTDPKILILDEPFSRIDSTSAFNLLDILLDLKKKGLIILLFEHHLDFLLDVADRLIILNNGEIISDNSPEESFNMLNAKLAPEIIKINIPGSSKKSFKFSEVYSNLLEYLSGVAYDNNKV